MPISRAGSHPCTAVEDRAGGPEIGHAAYPPTTGTTTLWVSHEKLWKSLWKLARKWASAVRPTGHATYGNRACDVRKMGMPRTPLVFTRAPIDSSRPSIERLVVDRPSPSPAPSAHASTSPSKKTNQLSPDDGRLKWSLRPICGAQLQGAISATSASWSSIRAGAPPPHPWSAAGGTPAPPGVEHLDRPAPHASVPWHRHGSERCHQGERVGAPGGQEGSGAVRTAAPTARDRHRLAGQTGDGLEVPGGEVDPEVRAVFSADRGGAWHRDSRCSR
jgi:hypothetical protein